LRSIVAFTPGRPARQVASLPRPLRYPAVAAVGQVLMIAGGTSGTTAQRAILRFDPRTGQVARIGKLPHPLTHGAGASRNGRFYVIGGRGSVLGSASAAVWSVDPAGGRAQASGRLPVALSDLGAASMPNGIVLVGGRDGRGIVHRDVLVTRQAP
jgi:N-acetylneuraminic acid mutarotase